MKSLFTFIENQGINWSLIWSDCSIYICIWMFALLVLLIVIMPNYVHSSIKEAEEKAQLVVQSLSHEFDMLELQNTYLRQSFIDHTKEIERLSKFERKRNPDGSFSISSGKGHGKKKNNLNHKL